MEGKSKGDRSYKNTPFEEKWWKRGYSTEGAETFSAFVSRTLKATKLPFVPLSEYIVWKCTVV